METKADIFKQMQLNRKLFVKQEGNHIENFKMLQNSIKQTTSDSTASDALQSKYFYENEQNKFSANQMSRTGRGFNNSPIVSNQFIVQQQ